MGGAERNARKRRQQHDSVGKAAAASRSGGGDRTKVIIGVLAVVIVLAAVIIGVIYTTNQKNATEDQQIPPVEVSNVDVPVSREGGAVLVGADGAKVTLDVYEDFLCPACGVFEEDYGETVLDALRSGDVRVRYHMLPMLSEKSDPAGYSLDAANAALCAADAGEFLDFHASLFASQPKEGARGWSDEQLADLLAELDGSSEFSSCVTSGKYDEAAQQELADVNNKPYLEQTFPNGAVGFGTPTFAVGERLVQPTGKDWLTMLVEESES